MFAWWISWWLLVAWACVGLGVSVSVGGVVEAGWSSGSHEDIEMDETAAAVAAVEVDTENVGPGMGGSAVEMQGLESVQRFATQPTPQTAVVGSTAVLPAVINKMGHLQWTKNGFGLGTERDLFGFSRYSMIGSDDEGDYSLRIRPVLLADDGVYQCQVSASAGVPGIRSHPARLTVYVPPDPPVLTPPALTTTAGDSITLTCRSSGGRPAPEIQWLDDSQRETILTGTTVETQPLEDGKRVRVVSTLTFTPHRSHHNATITCLTSNQALSSPLSSTVKLSVLFKPEVRVEVRPQHLVEGGDATFLCSAIANPQRYPTGRWYHNSQPVHNHTSKTFMLHQVTRHHHRDSVACEVTNSVGSGKASAEVMVQYGPQFRTLPRDVMAERGKRVSLTCDVDSNPPSSIVWLRAGSHKILGSGREFVVVVGARTAGEYECVARVRGFPEVRGRVHVLVKGPPTIVSAGRQEGRRGGTVSLECSTVSVPSPIRVTWTYNGREIDLSDPRYEVVQDRQDAGLRNTLLIHHSDTQDFGAYNCSVVNEYGVARKMIRLQEEKKVPVVMVAVGVGALVVVTLLAASVLLCTRTHSPPKGIGRATLEAFLREGAALVVAVDINGEKLKELESNPRVATRVVDVRDFGGIKALAKEFPGITVLFNCAGIVHQGNILETTEEEWDNNFNINIKSMYYTLQAFLPQMIAGQGGSIINMSSVASSIRGIERRCVYGTTKAAVIGLTKAVARDHVRQGVRCNVVCPSPVASPSFAVRGADEKDSDSDHVKYMEEKMIGRLAYPGEVANLCVYLASDESSYHTGNVFTIDGGFCL